MAETDPEGLADHLEDEADELGQRNEQLGEEARDVAQEWEAKRSDPAVPGAPRPTGGEEDMPPTGAPTGKRDERADR